MAQLAALGESMKARSSRGSITVRDSILVSSPGLEKSKTERGGNKSLLSRVLALTPSNQPRASPDLKVPIDSSIGGISPTGSDSSWGGLKSPNALKRQLIKNSRDSNSNSTPFQPVALSSPHGSQNDMESDRMISPIADMYMNKASYLQFRAVNESLIHRESGSFNFDQSEKGDSEVKEEKETKEIKEVKQVKENKEEKPSKAEKLSAFRDQLRIGLKRITENEDEDVEKRNNNERAKLHNFLFIQERRGSNPDKLDRKATMGKNKDPDSNVEVQEF